MDSKKRELKSNKSEVDQRYDLTQDPSNGNYMLVIDEIVIDLRNYLQQNHNQFTWEERFQIVTVLRFLLWKISSGQPPFINYAYDNLPNNTVNEKINEINLSYQNKSKESLTQPENEIK
ncbi:kinase-like domain-containing protein [Rhizophagus clarus]|uniref:Kinase-like domain-containing protein n=1 Tax=Rhizophagus clarus TaxID=94130 RepID=A0A8H3KX92_9GLOM|nr:kinase-like domain-containing protein [Rhizophagus clarus]